MSLPCIVGGVVIGGTALALGPGLVVGYLGFNAAGIAAGSTAASMMSAAGGTVAAGSTVAIFQSIGAAGLAVSTKLGLAAVGGSVGGFIGSLCE